MANTINGHLTKVTAKRSGVVSRAQSLKQIQNLTKKLFAKIGAYS